jgi:ribosomal protein S18 acetylase RimI-like enzyme
MNIEIISAYDHLDDVRKLFIEYQTSLGIDLCFQNYDEELKSLPGKYALPDGRLYMITIDEEIAGCIALRRFDKTRCEMKRLYIRPQYRGHHCGQLLVEKIIQEAKIIGYEEMVLDTLSSLKSAVSLYQRNGFIEVNPYYDNPLQDVLYFKLKL